MHAAVRKWTGKWGIRMANKQSYVVAAVVGVSTAGAAIGGYYWALYHSRYQVLDRVTVKCRDPLRFELVDPQGREGQTYLSCTPEHPVPIRGTAGVSILL